MLEIFLFASFRKLVNVRRSKACLYTSVEIMVEQLYISLSLRGFCFMPSEMSQQEENAVSEEVRMKRDKC